MKSIILILILTLLLLAGCATPPAATTPPAAPSTSSAQLTALEKKQADDIKLLTARIDKLTTELASVNRTASSAVTTQVMTTALTKYASPDDVLDLRGRVTKMEGVQSMYQSQLTAYQAKINLSITQQESNNAKAVQNLNGAFATRSDYLIMENKLNLMEARLATLEAKVK